MGFFGCGNRHAGESAETTFGPGGTERHARIEAVLTYLELRLKSTDAQLVPFNLLDQIDANLAQLTQTLRTFQRTPSGRALLTTDNQVNGILSFLGQLPPPAASDAQNLQAVGERYRRSMSAQTGGFTREVNQLRSQVEATGQRAVAQLQEIDAEKNHLEAAVVEVREEFAKAEGTRRKNFDDVIKRFEQEQGKSVQDANDKAQATWEEIEALRQRAETASNFIGQAALAGGYQETAKVEDTQAFWLRIAAIASLLAAAAAPVVALVWHIVHSFTLEGFFSKAAVALPFLILAGYLGRESSRHSDRAHFSRQRQRQLESLPAYMDGIEQEKRGALYETLAPGFFSPVAITTPGEQRSARDDDVLATTLRLLIEQLRKEI